MFTVSAMAGNCNRPDLQKQSQTTLSIEKTENRARDETKNKRKRNALG
jgi:hypothetical protein